MILQLSAYGLLWVVLPLIVFAVAREGGWRGALIVHALIAVLIVALDLHWVATHGLKPSETPLGIAIAMGLRALLVNVFLLPVGAIALALRYRHLRRAV